MSDFPEKKWLVRSSNIILGPYTKPEIKVLLKQSALVVHDEVTAPCTFWRALKDHPEFQDIVTSFRSKNPLSHLVTSLSGKLTSTFTASDPTKSLTEEITDTLESKQDTQPLMKETRTQKIPFSPEETAQPSPPALEKSPPPRPRQKQASPEQKAKKTSFVFWFAGALVLAGVSGYAVFQEVLRRKAEKTRSFSGDIIREAALSAYKAGNYEEALQNFSAGLEENLLGTEEKLLMISLLLQQNRSAEAEGLLESVPENERTDTRFPLVQGLLALHEKRFPLAEKLFAEAEIHHSKIALLNLSLVKFFEKDHKASLAYVEKLIQSGWPRGIVFYLKALNQTALSPKSADIEKSLAGYLEKTPEYHQEIYLLQAYLSALKGDKKKTEELVGEVLNRDPYFYRDYHYDSFAAVNLLGWSALSGYCDQVFKTVPQSALFNALKGFCLLKAGADPEGVSFIERAKAQAPEDPVILSVYGFYLIQSGLFRPAEEVLELSALRHNKRNLPLPHVMRGYLYESRGEWASAFQSWKRALSLDSYHITALAGIAVAAFHLRKSKDTAYYRERGLALYPHNRRLLILGARPAKAEPSSNGKFR